MSTAVNRQPTAQPLPKIKDVHLYRMSTPEHECPWGLKAVRLLKEKGIEFTDHRLTSRDEVDAFKGKHNVAATPQIFFGDERIGGYTDLAERFGVEAEQAEYSYTPVIALFGTAGAVAWAASLGIPGFMGIALSMLANQKLMDLDSFVESFEKYDLITQRVKPYSRAFPFLELLLGLGFLSGVAPVATGIGSLILGTSGAVSVFKAVYIDKLELNCACVGGNSKAPLGVVSFLENAIMVVMGAALLFGAATNTAKLEAPREIEPERISIVVEAQ